MINDKKIALIPVYFAKSGIQTQMYAKKISNTKYFAKNNSKNAKKNSK